MTDTQTEDEVLEDEAALVAEPVQKFDERCREPFEGLLFLGALQREFDYIGHKFVIRSLTQHRIQAAHERAQLGAERAVAPHGVSAYAK